MADIAVPLAAPPSAPPPAAPPTAPPAEAPRSMENLRERVAARLGATPGTVAPGTAPGSAEAPVAPPPAAAPPTEPAVETQPPAAPETTLSEEPEPDLDALPVETLDGEAAPPVPAAASEPELVPEIPLSDDPVVRELADKHPQIRQALRDHGLVSEIRKPPERDAAGNVIGGGLGFVPTVEEARAMWRSNVALTSMMEDLRSGEPDRQARFVQFMFGANGQPNETANAMLELQPDVLARVNPDGFARQANKYTEYQVRLLKHQAATTSDQDLAAGFFNAARLLQFAVTGSYDKTPEEQAAEAARVRTPEEIDLESRRAAIAAEEQRIKDHQQKEQTKVFRQNMDRLVAAQNQTRKADVKAFLGKALDGLDQNFQNYLIGEYDRKVQAEVDLTPDRREIVLGEGKSLAKSGQMQNLETYLKRRYRQLYMPGLQKHRSEFIRAAAGRRAAEVERQVPTPERAAQLQTSAQNRNPGGPSAAPTPQPMAAVEKKSDETGAQWAVRRAMARMSVAG